MTGKTVEIVVRCIAVYAGVPFISSLANWLTSISQPGGGFGDALLAATVMRLLLVIVLWLLAPALGRRIGAAGDVDKVIPGLEELAPLGFGIAGLVLAVFALPNVAMGIAYMATASPMQGGVVGSGMLWSGLVELLAGLGVFIGSRALARAFVAVRRA